MLAGCVPSAEPEPTPVESSTTSATPTPEPTVSEPPVGVPVTISCSDLVSAQVIYDFNPNFGLVDGFDPAASSLAALAIANNGIACRWINQTSGETLDVSVADLPEASLSALRANAGTAVPDFSSDGYFATAGGVGSAQAFTGSYWIAAVSTAFFDAVDAAPIVNAAIDALG
jgi:hypothetical protein